MKSKPAYMHAGEKIRHRREIYAFRAREINLPSRGWEITTENAGPRNGCHDRVESNSAFVQNMGVYNYRRSRAAIS